uniref:PEHE domain-containing protein n=1 Tax=Caenorhabditis tropicalis TaxID=1561998 RepID=A0A1I7TPB1_9PELO
MLSDLQFTLKMTVKWRRDLNRFDALIDKASYNPYESPDIPFIETTDKDPLEEEYPKAIHIGNLTEPCPFNGDLMFRGEKNFSCCKSVYPGIGTTLLAEAVAVDRRRWSRTRKSTDEKDLVKP